MPEWGCHHLPVTLLPLTSWGGGYQLVIPFSTWMRDHTGPSLDAHEANMFVGPLISYVSPRNTPSGAGSL